MLKIRTVDLEELRAHAEEVYPNECCGVLLGHVESDVRIIEKSIRCKNIEFDSTQRYSIAPADLIRIQRDAREQGLEIVGFYHSHPDHSPHWSTRDLAEAHWKGCEYTIISVVNGVAGEVNSYRLAGTDSEKKFVTEPVVTERIGD